MGALISVHGIDGTGKTTTATGLPAALSEKGLKAVYFDELDMPAFGYAENQAMSHYQISVAKKIGQSAVICELSSDTLVIKDRWMIDVAASNSYRDRLNYTVNPDGVIVPDLSVILTCAESERKKRISSRGNPSPDDLTPKEPGTRAAFFEAFLIKNIGSFSAHSLILDTTSLSEREVISRIVEAV